MQDSQIHITEAQAPPFSLVQKQPWSIYSQTLEGYTQRNFGWVWLRRTQRPLKSIPSWRKEQCHRSGHLSSFQLMGTAPGMMGTADLHLLGLIHLHVF